MKLGNLRIGVRLSLAFFVIFLMLFLVGYTGWSSLASTKARMDVIVNENNVETALSYQLQADLNVMARAVRNYILYKDSDKALQQKQLNRIDDNKSEFEKSFAQLGTLVKSDDAKLLYSEIKDASTDVLPQYSKVVELVNAGNAQGAIDLLAKSLQGSQEKLFRSIQGMVNLQEKQNQDAVSKMSKDYSSAIKLLFSVIALSIPIGGMLAWRITLSITRPMDEAVALAQSVAAGDLTKRVEVRSTDETGDLLRALQVMSEKLSSIVGQVRMGSDTIATATSQIAAGNLDLSARTEEQASSLEETAASMEELTSTVKQNADNALQANELAISASAVALKGGSVVSQVVDTMGLIDAASKKIVDIISVIEGIAFQTNILALNAAVEAARAGEQGRGFAVVASEVRSLAQRSASAAKDIKVLIGNSVHQVLVGSKLVAEAGSTMDEVVLSVKRVTDIMCEIAAASKEQSAGIEQVNQAVTQMDDVTQQNAALVEEGAAAAESLQNQAADLSKVVSIFNLGVDQKVAGSF